jgi:phosphoribosylanthranilate isomerase
LIQAFRVKDAADVQAANASPADYVLLDAATGGSGTVFEWQWLTEIHRPFFLAGGLTPENVAEACQRWHPFAVDVSSGIETDGKKDKTKMEAFVASARKESTR